MAITMPLGEAARFIGLGDAHFAKRSYAATQTVFGCGEHSYRLVRVCVLKRRVRGTAFDDFVKQVLRQKFGSVVGKKDDAGVDAIQQCR